MRLATVSVVLLGFLVTSAFGAAFKEGKTVLSKDYKVDITRMNWGTKDKETDRIMGTARLYVTSSEEYYSPIALTFDVFSKNSVSNALPAATVNGKPVGASAAPQAEKIDSFEITINFRKYGYRVMRSYIEGDFCVDLARNREANRLTLSNVKVNGEAVTYQTTFNINESLLKTSFTLSEPKAVPQVR
ncbi:MAG: hypothetical protein WCR06_04455 [bacterium]